MNTITKNFQNISLALAVVLFVAFAVALAPKAHASDWGDGGYDTIDTWGDGYDYSGGGYDTIDTWGDGYDSGGGYASGGGFSGGGFGFGGGFTAPMNYGGGGGSSYSNVYAPTNTNTCTAVNSCNSYWDDHSIFNAPTTIVTNTTTAAPQPVVYAQPQVYASQPYYPPQQPIAYNRPAPYVTLAAVPYTGLELGPVGTALYWGFLVLWCLIAAYLIAVKKVQNKIAAWFTGSAKGTTQTAHSAHAPVTRVAYAAPKAAPQFAGIDPFIQAQINRAN